jgi:hypothetical protein
MKFGLRPFEEYLLPFLPSNGARKYLTVYNWRVVDEGRRNLVPSGPRQRHQKIA